MRLPIIATLAALLCACGGDSSGPPASGEPWTEQFTSDNFTINNSIVQVTNSAATPNLLTRAAAASALPAAANGYKNFAVHVYLPAASGINSALSNIDVKVQATTGTTPNIFLSGDFVTRDEFNGKLYSLYRLTGQYAGADITPANFQKATFTFKVTYTGAGSVVLNTSNKTVEISKQP